MEAAQALTVEPEWTDFQHFPRLRKIDLGIMLEFSTKFAQAKKTPRAGPADNTGEPQAQTRDVSHRRAYCRGNEC